MDPLYRIVCLVCLILAMSWFLATKGAVFTGGRATIDKKLFKKLIFWCLIVPVAGTTVGTLVLFWLKAHGLI